MQWSAADTGLLVGAIAVSVALVAGVMFLNRRARPRAVGSGAPPEMSVDPMIALADLPILVLDLETTGLDVRRDRVVSVGALPGQGAQIHQDEVLDFFVHPERPIPPRSTAIHGITDAMVAGALAFVGAFPKLSAMLTGRVVVGHNIGFDLAILRGECKRVGLDWADPVALDIVRLAAALDPRERDLTLDGMAARWGISVSGRHTALGDARMAAEMWKCLLPRLDDAGVVTLGDALRFERRARAVIANQKRAGW